MQYLGKLAVLALIGMLSSNRVQAINIHQLIRLNSHSRATIQMIKEDEKNGGKAVPTEKEVSEVKKKLERLKGKSVPLDVVIMKGTAQEQ